MEPGVTPRELPRDCKGNPEDTPEGMIRRGTKEGSLEQSQWNAKVPPMAISRAISNVEAWQCQGNVKGNPKEMSEKLLHCQNKYQQATLTENGPVGPRIPRGGQKGIQEAKGGSQRSATVKPGMPK